MLPGVTLNGIRAYGVTRNSKGPAPNVHNRGLRVKEFVGMTVRRPMSGAWRCESRVIEVTGTIVSYNLATAT